MESQNTAMTNETMFLRTTDIELSHETKIKLFGLKQNLQLFVRIIATYETSLCLCTVLRQVYFLPTTTIAVHHLRCNNMHM